MTKKVLTKSAARRDPLSDAFESSFRNPEHGCFGQGTVQNYPAQTVIFHQDTQPHAVYLIEHGLVKLVRIVASGQSLIIGVRCRYWLIGAPSVLLDQLYSFTAITLVPSSLRCIPAKDFLDLAKTNAQFSWYLHRLLAQQVFKQMKNVEAMECLSAKDRMKSFLHDMIDDQSVVGPKLPSFSVPLSNKELAELLAITPEHLCRVLKQMKQEGIITCAKGLITVTDPASLL